MFQQRFLKTIYDISGTLGRCLGTFENIDRGHRTTVFVLYVKVRFKPNKPNYLYVKVSFKPNKPTYQV